jgi:hypothetical protein
MKYRQYKMIGLTECTHCNNKYIGEFRCSALLNDGEIIHRCMYKKNHRGMHSICGAMVGHHPLKKWK